MAEREMEALYMGGHPGFAVGAPTKGQVRLLDDGLHFMVMGEYFDTLFAIPWGEVTGWDVEGSSAATRRSTGGRAAVGALIAGIPGALVGMAATKEEFSAVLGVEVGDHAIAFLIRDRAPAAVVAALRGVDGMTALQRSERRRPPERVAWEYATASLDQLEVKGKEGWEAVGIWQASDQEPTVLFKRLLEP